FLNAWSGARQPEGIGDGLRTDQGPRPKAEGLVTIVVRTALFRCAAEFIERAIGTPRLRVEAGRPRDREDIAVTAAFDRALFRRPAPAARFESSRRRRHGRRLEVALAGSAPRHGGRRGKRKRVRHLVSL